ncbi:pyocin immunity protein [Salmonella enterica]|nr:pyocin immunity protein [Salmonella enterica]MHA89569.1 pyocin immunity protein [Salmonella enterica]MKT26030.1 pyocin immunity protein [Salmonella enterica]
MTVNINALISCLGKSYLEIVDSNLIPYSSEPKGHSGSPTLSLDLVREGVFLSFKREGRILKEITLYLQRDGVDKWVFPNELDEPLQKEMSREFVLRALGEPEGSVPPRKVLRHSLGWVDKFACNKANVPITMQIDYDLENMVKEVSYILTSEMRW